MNLQHQIEQSAVSSVAVPPFAACTACGSQRLIDFFETERLPVHVGVFLDSRAEALRAPSGPVTLSYCPNCGFVQNSRFDPSKVSYEPGYEVALHYSEIFRKFMEGVSERLIERFDLRGKTILEIGCGCGYFLRMLCRQGANRGIGIDPTVAQEGVEQVGGGRVEFIRDVFTDRYSHHEPDFICCLSVFEHIPNPYAFLSDLRRMIGDRRPAVYFEIFNAFRAFERKETWSIHYEQCNYFSQESFAGLFERCGFEVLEAAACYEGDQYLHVEARPGDRAEPPSMKPRAGENQLPEHLATFAECHRRKTDSWRRDLDAIAAVGRKAVVWGTGGKGISFLNTLDTAKWIEYVVDINTDKQGKFVPGSAQRIVAPEFLCEYRPDVVILTNSLYEQEIKKHVDELGLRCEFILA